MKVFADVIIDVEGFAVVEIIFIGVVDSVGIVVEEAVVEGVLIDAVFVSGVVEATGAVKVVEEAFVVIAVIFGVVNFEVEDFVGLENVDPVGLTDVDASTGLVEFDLSENETVQKVSRAVVVKSSLILIWPAE